MWPTLLKFGPVELKTYGLFVALGGLAGYAVLKKELQRFGQNPAAAEKIFLYAFGGGLLGGRLLYAFMEGLPLAEIPRIWEGGLSFLGGRASGALCGYGAAWRAGVPWKALGDAAACALPLGHAIGRLGCFAAGCCWGLPSDSWLAVTFRNPRCVLPSHLIGVGLYPAQLLEASALLGLSGVLWVLRPRFPGRLLGFYLAGYAILRSGLEMIRGDAWPLPGLPLTFAQAWLLGLALPAGLLWIYLAGGAKQSRFPKSF